MPGAHRAPGKCCDDLARLAQLVRQAFSDLAEPPPLAKGKQLVFQPAQAFIRRQNVQPFIVAVLYRFGRIALARKELGCAVCIIGVQAEQKSGAA